MEGKCKEDFEKWLTNSGDSIGYKVIYGHHESIDVEDVWNNLPESMKFGVIQDFADSVGAVIILAHHSKRLGWHCCYSFGGKDYEFGEHGTLTEARKEAEKQFVKWYNENK